MRSLVKNFNFQSRMLFGAVVLVGSILSDVKAANFNQCMKFCYPDKCAKDITAGGPFSCLRSCSGFTEAELNKDSNHYIPKCLAKQGAEQNRLDLILINNLRTQINGLKTENAQLKAKIVELLKDLKEKDKLLNRRLIKL